MKKIISLLVLLAVASAGGYFYWQQQKSKVPSSPSASASTPESGSPVASSPKSKPAPESVKESQATPSSSPESVATPPPSAPESTPSPAPQEEASTLPPQNAIYLSPQGNDANPGTKAKPVASLEKARDLSRALPNDLRKEVVFLPGDYYLDRSFQLGKEDSGTPELPTVYRAEEPRTVKIIGGRKIQKNQIAPVEDPQILSRLPESARGKVVSIPLQTLQLPAVPKLPPVITGNGPLFALYENGEILPISRWPNENFTTIATVTDSGLQPKPHGGTFKFREERPAAWADAPKDEGSWIEGYWRVPWVMDGVQIESISASDKTITLAAPVSQGIGSKYSPLVDGTRKGDGHERYRIRNILEELDQPGEWVYRYTDNTIYLWPKNSDQPEITIVHQEESTIEIKAANDLHLESLIVEGSKSSAIKVESGSRVSILGCEVLNTPGEGIVIKNGTDHAITSCDIHDVGVFGVRINGGDRKTLSPGHFKIVNNHIHHYGLINRNICGIDILGVGHLVANNLFHDSPYGGNNHIIEYNEVHNIGLEGGDLGGTYTGADWTALGNVIRYNFIHHSATANGSYLDDGDCGDEVYGNLYYKLACGPFLGGGSLSKIHDNVIVDCEKGIHVDDRGVSRKYGEPGSGHFKKAAAFDIPGEPWSTQYPAFAAWFSQKEISLGRPSHVELKRNLIVQCPTTINLGMSAENKKLILNDENVILDADPGFPNPAKLDFTLPDSHPLFTGGEGKPALTPIPLAKIGLFTDAWRKSLPSDESTGRFSSRRPTYKFDSKTDLNQTNQNALQKNNP
jgi:hypothetical protein